MANCNQATPDLTPEAMLELIKQCPPGPWPNAWGTWDNTIEAHRRLVDQYVDNLMPSRVTYAQSPLSLPTKTLASSSSDSTH